MVKVTIDPYFLGQDAGGEKRTVEVKGATVGECLRQVVEKVGSPKPTFFDGSGELSCLVSLVVNQVPLLFSKMEQAVKDGDEISVLYGTAGS
ncbi:MAG: hypothetical protein V1894_00220 [Chloroflexota bacterium]